MIRTVLIEDSELARFELEHQLRAYPQIEIVGQAGDVAAAHALIDALTPDLLLLDIDLPGGNAFELLERLEQIPQIIFTTAFDAYALQAFAWNTVDYLLKPIESERLAQAIAKLRPPQSAARDRLDLDSPIFVKDGERCFLVKVREIRLIEAIGNYSRLYFGAHSPMLYRALGAIEARLDPAQFFRCSRKHLVNLSYVESISPWINGGLQLRLKGGSEIEVSRRQSNRLRELLSL